MSAITSRPRSLAVHSVPGRSEVLGGDQRIVIRGVGRHVYQCLSAAVGEGQQPLLAYDGKDLELMTTGHMHERYKELLGQFVTVVTLALDIDRERMGETTWDTPDAERGLQADLSYYFTAEKLRCARDAFARQSQEPSDYPSPDLAIEIDLSPPKVDRHSIYAALRVEEIWRFDGATVVIEHLQPDGTYVPSERSRFLPVAADDVRHWLLHEDATRSLAWERRLADWARRIARPVQPDQDQNDKPTGEDRA
jgi:Uma2 family endonuclease